MEAKSKPKQKDTRTAAERRAYFRHYHEMRKNHAGRPKIEGGAAQPPVKAPVGISLAAWQKRAAYFAERGGPWPAWRGRFPIPEHARLRR